MNLTGRGPGRDKGGVQSGRIGQDFSRLFRSVKLARRSKTITATFAGRIADRIKLKKEDGTVITVTLDQLSETDQKWLENRSKK